MYSLSAEELIQLILSRFVNVGSHITVNVLLDAPGAMHFQQRGAFIKTRNGREADRV